MKLISTYIDVDISLDIGIDRSIDMGIGIDIVSLLQNSKTCRRLCITIISHDPQQYWSHGSPRK